MSATDFTGRGICLRPHHLLCLQRFRGLGYSDDFVENMERVVDAVLNGVNVEVVRGEDEICAACDEECDEESVNERDDAVLMALPKLTLEAARSLPVDDAREICGGCPWFEVCYG